MKIFYALIAILALAGCQSYSSSTAWKQARADLEAKSGSAVTGYVTFFERSDRVLVSVKVGGLKPNSEHGFHVHEKGDCSSADAMSAGGHFNPDAHAHGNPKQVKRHAGAMVNLIADAKGESTVSFDVDTIRVDHGKYGILDRAVIIHSNPDDYVSQPVGNAGGRLACGLIKKI